MAHKTLINGTAYEVDGGRTLVNGTGYEIDGGRTLVNGTGYDVSFGVTWNKYGASSTQKQDGYRESKGTTTTATVNGLYSEYGGRTLRSSYTFSTTTGKFTLGDSMGIYLRQIAVDGKSKSGYVNAESGLTTASEIYYLAYSSSAETFTWYKITSAAKYVITYYKTSTSYGTVTVAEGEVPEGGTIVQGSVASGTCAVKVDGTVYWYEKV